ncbi:MAG: dephospho-CoA kinase, partial [Bacteroidales bacterium]|nr:dephospho-CoA kinase [Bacteroidales bacterium]
MLKVGLTGNIGSGKSTVAGIFRVLGIPVFSADQAGRNVMEREDVAGRIAESFGAGVCDAEGRIKRPVLAEKVFADPEALQQLNRIVHPEVRSLWLAWAETHREHPYVLHEAAILMESGFY